ncbi:DUF4129 domain-containing protein [Mangrovibacterium marinum]|uniref:Uncharacterized protein DUF4129 n=1 Tax=Mangrovibacterium marinum TaxID=1639118 RepID=A0A2T5BZB0_9BACT|nr:DUF4129 domain-containing protein [Mangrovibacterium marinum]PTN07592.1 uncharacterized protein DUF4129 [Mangrovibacterium marinum]
MPDNKRHITRFVLLCILLLGIGQFCFALVPESRQTKAGHFNEEKLAKFRSNRDFSYENNSPMNDSIRERIRYYIHEFLKFIFSDKGAAPYIRYTVLAAIIVAAIVYLTGGKYQWFLAKESNVKAGIVALPQDDITQIDLESLANRASQNKDYRLSIRYHYLHLLSLLNEHQYIDWHKDKTNTDYLHEIKPPDIKAQFKQNTVVFDYVWYGQFQVNDQQFYAIRESFRKLTESLQNRTGKE